MPAKKTSKQASSTALRHLFRWLNVAVLAGALGGTLALGALRYAPEASAEVAGLLACPGQAATVAQVEALDVASGQKAWRLNVPQLRCANAKGVPHVGAASLNGRWYAAFAAWAITAATLGYAALSVAGAGAPVRAASPFRAHRGVLVMKSVSPEEPLEDYPAQFLAECCDVGSRKRMTSAELHAAYAAWCRAKGQRPLGRKHLTRDWKRLGLKPKGLLSAKAWRGAALKEQI